MPNYGALPNVPAAVGQSATALYAGDELNLFNAETPAAPQASIAVALPKAPVGGYAPIVFDIEFAAAPTDSLLIQGAMVDTDSAYQTLYTSTNLQQDNYQDLGGFQFYRAKLASQSAGGAVTVTVRR